VPYDTLTAPGRVVKTTGCGGGCGCNCGGCDTCDSLQCLCRPRFFAGQLVTDADFNRLDQYLVGKDRLHNRYLHGTGVVCGLEVVCNPCDDTVTVRPGYALGPCGEDIVVCADTSVDVGAMIRAERQAKARTVDCSPYSNPPNDDCDAAEQPWILSICYDEQPSRPVTSLKSTASSACGCGGGASSSCGCGGGGTRTAGCGCGSSSGGSVRPTAVACEPTVICEGFRFTLTKVTPTRKRDDSRRSTVGGELAERAKACLTDLTSRITTVPSNPKPEELVEYCCVLKSDLRDVIDTGNIHDCRLGQRLNDIVCPAVNDDKAAEKAQQAILGMLAIVVDLFRECLCSALLPPCPNSCDDDCVPLATLTVRSSDLRVLDVCNWSSRKFAVTFPMLGYWLGSLGFGALLRQLVSRLCCPPDKRVGFELNNKLRASPAAMKAAPKRRSQASRAAAEAEAETETERAATEARIPDAMKVAAQYAGGASPLAGLEATVLQSLGLTDPDGNELATEAELGAPFAALALARFVGPAVAQLAAPLRQPLGEVLDRATPAPEVDADRFAALEQTVAKLQKTVNTQARTIATLRNRGAGK
jgi:hypothetical protein